MTKKLAGNKKVSISQLSQEIDLKFYLGEKPTAKQKKLFAEIAKDVIDNRTLDGKDINGKKFTRYSEKYADGKGVTRDSVDLFLDGPMLDGIGRRKSKEKTNTLFMQMKKGLQTKKAFNHDTGDTLKRREFFGITDKEAKDIAIEMKENAPEVKVSFADLLAAMKLLENGDDNGIL